MRFLKIRVNAKSSFFNDLFYDNLYFIDEIDSKPIDTFLNVFVENSKLFTNLLMLKFTRVLFKDDRTFSVIFEKKGKPQNEFDILCGNFKNIEPFVSNKSIVNSNGTRYVSGLIKINDPTNSIELRTEIVNLVCSKSFSRTGIIGITMANSSELENNTRDAIQKDLEFFIKCNSKSYQSQNEWDNDYNNKRFLLTNIINQLLSLKILVVLPMVNDPPKKGYLLIESNEIFQKLIANIEISDIDENELISKNKYEIGLLH